MYKSPLSKASWQRLLHILKPLNASLLKRYSVQPAVPILDPAVQLLSIQSLGH